VTREVQDISFKDAIQRTAHDPSFRIENVPDCLWQHFQNPDSVQEPWESFEREEKIALARTIIAGMDTQNFRAFYLEFTFASKLHSYARQRIKELFDSKRISRARQDSFLELLHNHMTGESQLSESPLQGEIEAQFKLRAQVEDDPAWADFYIDSPADDFTLGQTARNLIIGNSRYNILGYSYRNAAELDHNFAAPARKILSGYGIRQTFVRAGEKDPVDLFLARWGRFTLQQHQPNTNLTRTEGSTNNPLI